MSPDGRGAAELEEEGTCSFLFAVSARTSGDQVGYPDTFLDGMGMLYETFQYRGAKFIGFWETTGYDFTSPLPLLDHDHFVGLAIDEDNQPELTDERIEKWCQQIKPQLGL